MWADAVVIIIISEDAKPLVNYPTLGSGVYSNLLSNKYSSESSLPFSFSFSSLLLLVLGFSLDSLQICAELSSLPPDHSRKAQIDDLDQGPDTTRYVEIFFYFTFAIILTFKGVCYRDDYHRFHFNCSQIGLRGIVQATLDPRIHPSALQEIILQLLFLLGLILQPPAWGHAVPTFSYYSLTIYFSQTSTIRRPLPSSLSTAR